jgi:hypothetical protein
MLAAGAASTGTASDDGGWLTSIAMGASVGCGLSATGVPSDTFTLRLSGRFAVVATGTIEYREGR